MILNIDLQNLASTKTQVKVLLPLCLSFCLCAVANVNKKSFYKGSQLPGKRLYGAFALGPIIHNTHNHKDVLKARFICPEDKLVVLQ